MKRIIETRVVNLRKEKYDVYIGRGNKWGNPFVVGKDGTREEVVNKYEKWIFNNIELMLCISELRGKILGCYCKPQNCHGTILLKLVGECFSDKLIDNFTLIGE